MFFKNHTTIIIYIFIYSYVIQQFLTFLIELKNDFCPLCSLITYLCMLTEIIREGVSKINIYFLFTAWKPSQINHN